MVLVDGRHHLFYSGNRWETSGYAVGHAVCASVTGPCRRTSEAPVLRSRSGEAGPGGQEVLRVDGHGPVLVHHAWDPGAVGLPRAVPGACTCPSCTSRATRHGWAGRGGATSTRTSSPTSPDLGTGRSA